MLPDAWVKRIHGRLLVRYGVAWIRMWEGIPEDAVRADWAEMLSGVSAESMDYALDNLPLDKPPNAAQFKALCINRPAAPLKALPAPEVSEERKQEIREMLAKAKAKLTGQSA